MKIFGSCASSDYIDDKYKSMGKEIGEFIGKSNHTLVFGSSKNGIMGEVYTNTKKHGGKIIAILPKSKYGVLTDLDCDQLIVVEKDTDQFHDLVKHNDAIIVLPGSTGMLAELCLAIHYNSFAENRKKVIIVNQYGFFEYILKAFDKFVEEKFAYGVEGNLYDVVDTIEEAIQLLNDQIS